MAISRSRFGASLAALAAFSLTAGPALANHNGWGWNDWGRYRHRDRVDVGDVLTGVLILGGIVAIANAASSSNRERDRRRDDRRDRDEGYGRDARYGDQAPGGYRGAAAPSWSEDGLSAAVDRCTAEVEGDGARAQVDSVNRDGDSWRVQGRSGEGRTFLCTVDSRGQIRNMTVEGEQRSEAVIDAKDAADSDDDADVNGDIDVETEDDTAPSS